MALGGPDHSFIACRGSAPRHEHNRVDLGVAVVKLNRLKPLTSGRCRGGLVKCRQFDLQCDGLAAVGAESILMVFAT